MLVGYARVSTLDQNPQLQQDALEEADRDRVFTDRMSCSTTERPGPNEALSFLRTTDTLAVWRLDRLEGVFATHGYLSGES
jgi:DNA invertase Pin-like site-specific DNA recombinase